MATAHPILALPLALALIAASASAETWQQLGVTGSGLRLFVDVDSIVPVAGGREARIMIGSPGVITGRIVETRQRERFDCAGRQWGLLSFQGLDETGAIVASQAAPTAALTMHPVIDDSAEETIFDAVCTTGAPPP